MKALLKRDFSPNSYMYRVNYERERTGLIYRVVFTGYEEIGKNYYLKRSEHYSYMLTYILEGSGTLIYRGDYYSLVPNDLIFISCLPEHELFPDKNGMKIIYVHLDNVNLDAFFDYVVSVESPVLKFDGDTIGFYSTIKSIHNDIQKGVYNEMEASQQIYQLLLRIYETIQLRNIRRPFVPENVNIALKFIDENYMHEITLDKIAEAANFTKFHLEKLFNKYVNMTIQKYVESVRLKKSQDLLLRTDFTIEEIALMVGLADSQSLIRLFRRNCDTTPLQFRKENRF